MARCHGAKGHARNPKGCHRPRDAPQGVTTPLEVPGAHKVVTAPEDTSHDFTVPRDTPQGVTTPQDMPGTQKVVTAPRDTAQGVSTSRNTPQGVTAPGDTPGALRGLHGPRGTHPRVPQANVPVSQPQKVPQLQGLWHCPQGAHQDPSKRVTSTRDDPKGLLPPVSPPHRTRSCPQNQAPAPWARPIGAPAPRPPGAAR